MTSGALPQPPTIGVTAQGTVWVLALEGEHAVATVHDLEGHMERLAASVADIVIDLSSATFIHCQVVTWLVRWAERASRSDVLHLRVAVGESGSFTARLLGLLTRLELIGPLPIATTRAEALTSVQIDPRAGGLTRTGI